MPHPNTNNRYMDGQSLIKKAFNWKVSTEQGLQAFGRRIRKNIIQGQADFKNRPNNKNYYGTINPFK